MYGHSATQERVMKAQIQGQDSSSAMLSGRKTLEINPNHPVIVDLLNKVKANKEDEGAKSTAFMLFQTAMVEGGYQMADPSTYVRNVYRMMSKDLGVDPDAPIQEVEIPEEEEEQEDEDKDEEEEKEDKKEEL